MTLDKSEKRFDLKVDALFEFMQPQEVKIQSFFLRTVGNVISLERDEGTGVDCVRPEMKRIDKAVFRETSPGVFVSEKWTMEWLEISLTDAWGLSLHFPSVMDLYL
jgi:hypothetical protein